MLCNYLTVCLEFYFKKLQSIQRFSRTTLLSCKMLLLLCGMSYTYRKCVAKSLLLVIQ